VAGGDAEQGAERGVEIGLQMLQHVDLTRSKVISLMARKGLSPETDPGQSTARIDEWAFPRSKKC
jgi:hypothetical protein